MRTIVLNLFFIVVILFYFAFCQKIDLNFFSEDHSLQPLYIQGKKIVYEGREDKVVACITCHGDNAEGLGGVDGFPRISNQREDYLLKQLNDYKESRRVDPNEVMLEVAKTLSEQDIQAVSYYLSHAPEMEISTEESTAKNFKTESINRGKLISELGIWEKAVPACVKCHGPAAEGMAPFFPRLAGQHFNYAKNQLLAFISHTRNNDQDGLMRNIALNLTHQEIDDVLAYYEKISPTKKVIITNEELRTIPFLKDVPNGPMGDMVLNGYRIFTQTDEYAPEYRGKENRLRCVNCHLHGGFKKDSAPIWGAYGMYPQYRSKNKKVNTFANRIQACFKYSLNGKGPNAESEVTRSLTAFAYYSARGTPLGKRLEGSQYPVLKAPKFPASKERGKVVYEKNCMHCHARDGAGRTSLSGVQVFPPLWGRHSFNWAAGMHRIYTVAGFIKANMPFGHDNILSDQEVWDVSIYINHFNRPEDPRLAGSRESFRNEYHNHQCEY